MGGKYDFRGCHCILTHVTESPYHQSRECRDIYEPLACKVLPNMVDWLIGCLGYCHKSIPGGVVGGDGGNGNAAGVILQTCG